MREPPLKKIGKKPEEVVIKPSTDTTFRNPLTQEQIYQILDEYEASATYYQTYSSLLPLVDFVTNSRAFKPENFVSEKAPAEVKLLAAVVALAIRDLTKPPIKIAGTGRKMPRYELPTETITACNFLFTDTCYGYLELLGITPKEFQKRLVNAINNRRPIDIGELSESGRRTMRLNYAIWKESYQQYLNAAVEEDEDEDVRL